MCSCMNFMGHITRVGTRSSLSHVYIDEVHACATYRYDTGLTVAIPHMHFNHYHKGEAASHMHNPLQDFIYTASVILLTVNHY